MQRQYCHTDGEVRPLRILVDTNILIPLEPTSPSDLELGTPLAIDLIRYANEKGHHICYHPSSRAEIAADKDVNRRSMRLALLKKYEILENPPAPSNEMQDSNISSHTGPHDLIDLQLLAAVAGDAVDILVTDDRGIWKTSERFQLEDRVYSIDGAVELLQSLLDKIPRPPPAIRNIKAHEIDQHDPIFSSLRDDYKGFDGWLAKCKREHRQAWIVINPGAAKYGGVAIVKEERNPDVSLEGRVLKICTFKASDDSAGSKFGELLLRTIFEYSYKNLYDWMYLTTLPKQEKLIRLLSLFGFNEAQPKAVSKELYFAKHLKPSTVIADSLTAMDFHILYGPRFFRTTGVPTFVVPIRPQYHKLLFPELEPQPELVPGRHPYGNAIRKAYLCGSMVKAIPPASILLFYRSHERQGIYTVGITERTIGSNLPNEIAKFVGSRTVYTYMEIEEWCKKRVLAILFRQARCLDIPISLTEMKNNGALRGAPQSIVTVPKEAMPWLTSRLDQ